MSPSPFQIINGFNIQTFLLFVNIKLKLFLDNFNLIVKIIFSKCFSPTILQDVNSNNNKSNPNYFN